MRHEHVRRQRLGAARAGQQRLRRGVIGGYNPIIYTKRELLRRLIDASTPPPSALHAHRDPRDDLADAAHGLAIRRDDRYRPEVVQDVLGDDGLAANP